MPKLTSLKKIQFSGSLMKLKTRWSELADRLSEVYFLLKLRCCCV